MGSRDVAIREKKGVTAAKFTQFYGVFVQVKRCYYWVERFYSLLPQIKENQIESP